MKHPETLSSKSVYSGFFGLRQDLLLRADGETSTYTVLELGVDATCILAQCRDGRFVIDKEYRYPTKRTLLCCPGGRLDPEEEPHVGAARELLEETGYAAEEMILLGIGYPIPGLSDQRVHFFFAKNAWKSAEPSLDPMECIQTELMSLSELHTAIRHCDLDCILLAALQFYHLSL